MLDEYGMNLGIKVGDEQLVTVECIQNTKDSIIVFKKEKSIIEIRNKINHSKIERVLKINSFNQETNMFNTTLVYKED